MDSLDVQHDGFMRLMQEKTEGSNGGEYVRCTNRSSGKFFSVEDLATYERSAVGGVHHVYGERFSALSLQETLRLFEGGIFREES